LRRFASAGGVDRFVDDLLGYGSVLLEERAQPFVHYRLHDASDVGIYFPWSAFELRLRQLYADHGYEAFADVVSGENFLLRL